MNQQQSPERASASVILKVSGISPVTREMVHQRTRELTAIAGRDPRHVLQTDYEQAKRELTGEIDGDRQQAVLNALAPVGDEDGEGRSVTEQFFGQGTQQAERDKVGQSARENRV